jgi:hypothetical protein
MGDECMNFIEKCLNVFYKTSPDYTLINDAKNLNEWCYHMQNFYIESRETIIDFIVNVRLSNPFFSLSQQSIKLLQRDKKEPIKTLYQLNLDELYNQLNDELLNIACKCAYDSIQTCNNLTNEESESLMIRFVECDEKIFNDYIHK